MLIINSNLYSHVQLASYLVPEREHDVCPPTGIQLLSTNATSDDNPTAMFVDCGGFGILHEYILKSSRRGTTPGKHNILVSLATMGALNCPATLHCG